MFDTSLLGRFSEPHVRLPEAAELRHRVATVVAALPSAGTGVLVQQSPPAIGDLSSASYLVIIQNCCRGVQKSALGGRPPDGQQQWDHAERAEDDHVLAHLRAATWVEPGRAGSRFDTTCSGVVPGRTGGGLWAERRL